MTAHELIAIPVGEVFEPTINPTAGVVIERPQSDLNGLCDDDFFHGSLPLSDGERSQNHITLHFPGEDSTIAPPADARQRRRTRPIANRPSVRSYSWILPILGHHPEIHNESPGISGAS